VRACVSRELTVDELEGIVLCLFVTPHSRLRRVHPAMATSRWIRRADVASCHSQTKTMRKTKRKTTSSSPSPARTTPLTMTTTSYPSESWDWRRLPTRDVSSCDADYEKGASYYWVKRIRPSSWRLFCYCCCSCCGSTAFACAKDSILLAQCAGRG